MFKETETEGIQQQLNSAMAKEECRQASRPEFEPQEEQNIFKVKSRVQQEREKFK